jgi:hypothetical protein
MKSSARLRVRKKTFDVGDNSDSIIYFIAPGVLIARAVNL